MHRVRWERKCGERVLCLYSHIRMGTSQRSGWDFIILTEDAKMEDTQSIIIIIKKKTEQPHVLARNVSKEYYVNEPMLNLYSLS